MELKDKIEHLKFIVGRYDHYYEGVNNKGNVFLALSTFLLGGTVAGYYSLLKEIQGHNILMTLVVSSVVFNIISILFSLWAVKPFLSSKNHDNSGSLMYFVDISNYSYATLVEKYHKADYERIFHDLLKQTQILATGLKNKLRLIKWAIYALAAQMVVIIAIGFLILK